MTLTQLIVKTIAASKTGLVNSQIAAKVQKRRPGTAPETIDAMLNYTSKKGLVQKTPTLGLMGKSKFVYSVPKAPSVRAIILETVKGKTKIDSLEIHMAVRSIRAEATKHQVDNALFQLAAEDKIVKSKNLMTDDNVISTQSKFVYTGKPTR